MRRPDFSMFASDDDDDWAEDCQEQVDKLQSELTAARSTGEQFATELDEAQRKVSEYEAAIRDAPHCRNIGAAWFCNWRKPNERGIIDANDDCTPANCLWARLQEGGL